MLPSGYIGFHAFYVKLIQRAARSNNSIKSVLQILTSSAAACMDAKGHLRALGKVSASDIALM